ncbi:MSMEG_0565 family glycosyltransferase [Rhodococcus sp. BP-349]|uniref:MSMEG_0565 family glycosyltransferase n=1 Tax=unclassified Rhodococcus (in: high G+C Gram-positive bacteria) TaxID=192944 RepID=UPI001C9A76EE|nr:MULTISPECIES: MSMEG_0565 family glycosyltransferase [unclassified Rhodococcus (in: high G+C Gram-positive bacteria)]MBY6539341.1 MSMEG_0565 family glycosyltransferase [Rhodococcus sp. BP-363]MBY6544331.1 MSMEG_0565 family glycosyltransferase [Rhodococcus sp. BP-369]MBY6563561.1 MSMEG_0565 family glycosyltransferase [Rhodococcus sp. BP-370]MBY6577853.1 MSMEG_0565 family glycosyltransferase [Rhodococcus sp. BP-364]MBY6587154.1 MSMEG_0565 family glycosyltransferase [Rhodococcus sp. BP-358]
MRVALLTYSTKPRGGVVHTVELAEALARAGADVTVWSLARGGDEGFYRAIDPAVTVRLVPFPAREHESVGDRILRSIALMRSAFDPGDADVVHAQDCITANAVGRCVRTIHHLEEFTTPELAACHERAVVEPHARICVSRAVADEVRAGWGLSPTVIPNGVDHARFAAARGDEWRTRLGRYVLAVGGIEPRKGSIDLLEAHAVLRERRPDVGLVFAGGETLFDYRGYRAEFDTRLAELAGRPEAGRSTGDEGPAPRVLGTVDHDVLPSLVAGASAFAFLSTKEGFGLAAMEALAASVPVVVRDLPVFREVFGDAVRYGGNAGGTAAALEDALTSDDRAAAGRALAARTSWDDAAAAHLAFYAGLAHR